MNDLKKHCIENEVDEFQKILFNESLDSTNRREILEKKYGYYNFSKKAQHTLYLQHIDLNIKTYVEKGEFESGLESSIIEKGAKKYYKLVEYLSTTNIKNRIINLEKELTNLKEFNKKLICKIDEKELNRKKSLFEKIISYAK